MTKIKKIVNGIGINDADYVVQPTVNGKLVMCPYYQAWHSMLQRCYSVKLQENKPTYKGCAVCDEWLLFMSFKEWMTSQDWEGKELDKDLLSHGNKIYSPATCIFVSRAVNALFNDNKAIRGEYKQGVYFNKRANKFKAQCNINGNRTYLGYYKTEEEASIAYKTLKLSHCIKIANEQTDARLKQAIIRKANILFN